MRQSLTLALRHTTTRHAFVATIADRPMMTNVLADMAVEVEAATLMALRVARATDDLDSVEHERLLARVATPAAKFFNCSRAPSIACEALQCHGGNGFIEENPMARLYREAPLNSVWEGTANMMCMDVRRAMMKDPRTIDVLFDEVRPLAGQDGRYDALVQHTERLVRKAVEDEFFARPMTETFARLLQGAELLRHSTKDVVDVFLEHADSKRFRHVGLALWNPRLDGRPRHSADDRSASIGGLTLRAGSACAGPLAKMTQPARRAALYDDLAGTADVRRLRASFRLSPPNPDRTKS